MTKPAEFARPTQRLAPRAEQGPGAEPAQSVGLENPVPAFAPTAGPARSPSPGGRSGEVGASFDAEYLDNPRPAYPAEARRRHLEGLVELWVEVGADGRPGEIAVHRSSAVPDLDVAALDAVRRWRFVPARRGETPVAGEVIVPLRFSLSDAR
ncbi:MAG TPA: energy transducer TonB [Rhodocyclaceae bacterium]|uniref:energy transducer TonB n=1 Tax=Zoogloea sp. TaxID=49181 RepID=UPI002BC928D7|nr:energy transducer TonB [Zoogloea sp.]HMV63502.1 energy transducer TonB [Rhodocyclaceae bacterium]HMW52127.1 energy transducer TonB [Rhodocyclaceae bacterium]HMY48441.1 energy transducer TonB [Rhodocyclaceae bacterium]HMZ75917.1 energy transducer TonB [Rhodocyclaceae bacterium]HNA67965.1 energy transducer TonB [Rhodocyclaceae bacterium]